MTTQQPRFLKGGFVLIGPSGGGAGQQGGVVRTLPMLINPASLTRSLEIKSMGEEGGRAAPLRLMGPPVETLTVEAKLEVADALARGDPVSVDEGVRPHIAALQMLLAPSSDQLKRNDELQAAGTLEIVPMDQPLSLFVWGPGRILPVRLTSFQVVEEFFNSRLYPLAATVTLGMRSLSVDDLGVSSRGGAIYLTYLRGIEESAARLPAGQLSQLGVEGAL